MPKPFLNRKESATSVSTGDPQATRTYDHEESPNTGTSSVMSRFEQEYGFANTLGQKNSTSKQRPKFILFEKLSNEE